MNCKNDITMDIEDCRSLLSSVADEFIEDQSVWELLMTTQQDPATELIRLRIQGDGDLADYLLMVAFTSLVNQVALRRCELLLEDEEGCHA